MVEKYPECLVMSSSNCEHYGDIDDGIFFCRGPSFITKHKSVTFHPVISFIFAFGMTTGRLRVCAFNFVQTLNNLGLIPSECSSQECKVAAGFLGVRAAWRSTARNQSSPGCPLQCQHITKKHVFVHVHSQLCKGLQYVSPLKKKRHPGCVLFLAVLVPCVPTEEPNRFNTTVHCSLHQYLKRCKTLLRMPDVKQGNTPLYFLRQQSEQAL